MNGAELSLLCKRITQSGDALRALGPAARRASLLRAAALLKAPPWSLSSLADSSGLSEPMTSWALRTTAETVTEQALDSFLDEITRNAGARTITPARLGAVVLAGNVFSAALRPVFLHLLLGCPVIVKPSSREPVFAPLLHRALTEVDPKLAQAFGIATFEGGEHAPEAALFENAEVISLYGSDLTLQEIAARAPQDALVLHHGHGLGVAFVSAAGLDDSGRCAHALALDIAAYDQRGCLSPQMVFVEQGGATTPREFAARLALEALPALAESLPRGPLSQQAAVAQTQWRGVARATGELFEGPDFAVSFEGATSPRPAPGYRNIAVHAVSDWANVLERITPLGAHLKCLGTVEPVPRLPQWGANVRICALGTMQTPPFELAIEGRRPWSGLVRFEAG